MTQAAWYVLMRALERKRRLFFVVEPGSLPLGSRMAVGAIHSTFDLELASMDIFVATLALLRRFEWNGATALLHVAHLVTGQARYRAVPARQSKIGRSVIKRLQLLPRNQAVTGLTDALRGSEPRDHYFGKFSLVRILVAPFTCEAGEVVLRDGAVRMNFLVAVLAGYCGVSSREHKARGLVVAEFES